MRTELSPSRRILVRLIGLAWYYNVKAHPEVTLWGRGFGGSFRAEELVGRERDRLFQLATAASSPYEHYERTAGKPIPVIAFHPSR